MKRVCILLTIVILLWSCATTPTKPSPETMKDWCKQAYYIHMRYTCNYKEGFGDKDWHRMWYKRYGQMIRYFEEVEEGGR